MTLGVFAFSSTGCDLLFERRIMQLRARTTRNVERGLAPAAAEHVEQAAAGGDHQEGEEAEDDDDEEAEDDDDDEEGVDDEEEGVDEEEEEEAIRPKRRKTGRGRSKTKQPAAKRSHTKRAPGPAADDPVKATRAAFLGAVLDEQLAKARQDDRSGEGKKGASRSRSRGSSASTTPTFRLTVLLASLSHLIGDCSYIRASASALKYDALANTYMGFKVMSVHADICLYITKHPLGCRAQVDADVYIPPRSAHAVGDLFKSLQIDMEALKLTLGRRFKQLTTSGSWIANKLLEYGRVLRATAFGKLLQAEDGTGLVLTPEVVNKACSEFMVKGVDGLVTVNFSLVDGVKNMVDSIYTLFLTHAFRDPKAPDVKLQSAIKVLETTRILTRSAALGFVMEVICGAHPSMSRSTFAQHVSEWARAGASLLILEWVKGGYVVSLSYL